MVFIRWTGRGSRSSATHPGFGRRGFGHTQTRTADEYLVAHLSPIARRDSERPSCPWRKSENLKDGIYRAARRGESNFMRARAEDVAKELQTGSLFREGGKQTLTKTRHAVTQGWESLIDSLSRRGDHQLATATRAFVDA